MIVTAWFYGPIPFSDMIFVKILTSYNRTNTEMYKLVLCACVTSLICCYQMMVHLSFVKSIFRKHCWWSLQSQEDMNNREKNKENKNDKDHLQEPNSKRYSISVSVFVFVCFEFSISLFRYKIKIWKTQEKQKYPHWTYCTQEHKI